MPVPAVTAALIGGGLSLAGGLFSNAKNVDLSREQMAFQREMANTQYQRAARDLEKAGLNRILALGSPAAAPAGARPNIVNPTAGMASSAKDVGLLSDTKTLLRQQTAKEAALTQLAYSQGASVNKDTIAKALDNKLKAYEVEFWDRNPLLRNMNLMNNTASSVIQGLRSAPPVVKSLKQLIPKF